MYEVLTRFLYSGRGDTYFPASSSSHAPCRRNQGKTRRQAWQAREHWFGEPFAKQSRPIICNLEDRIADGLNRRKLVARAKVPHPSSSELAFLSAHLKLHRLSSTYGVRGIHSLLLSARIHQLVSHPIAPPRPDRRPGQQTADAVVPGLFSTNRMHGGRRRWGGVFQSTTKVAPEL